MIYYAILTSWILTLQLLQNSYTSQSQQNFSLMPTDHVLCILCIQSATARYAEPSQLECKLMGAGAQNRKSTVNTLKVLKGLTALQVNALDTIQYSES